jgi:SAM-dependent methyltransferase
MSELQAVRKLLPQFGDGVEIGVGTGRFAAPLGVEFGIEPSASMGRIARQRGVKVARGVAENLPLADAQFDLALMVTTICFLDDVEAAFGEVHRILKDRGTFVVGFIDKDSPVGRSYRRRAKDSAFYSIATFYTAGEITRLLTQSGFRDIATVQTIFAGARRKQRVEPVKDGCGEGSFLVVRGVK